MSIRKSPLLLPRTKGWLGAGTLGAAILAGTALPALADEALADLVESVSPSVVTIIAEQDAKPAIPDQEFDFRRSPFW